MLDRTMTFSLGDDKEQAMKVILTIERLSDVITAVPPFRLLVLIV